MPNQVINSARDFLRHGDPDGPELIDHLAQLAAWCRLDTSRKEELLTMMRRLLGEPSAGGYLIAHHWDGGRYMVTERDLRELIGKALDSKDPAVCETLRKLKL